MTRNVQCRLRDLFLICSWVVVSSSASAEDLTVTTYYPSPRGVYDELRTLGDVKIGDVSATAPQGRLEVQGSTLSSAGKALYVGNANDDPRLVVEDGGNVGIGTASPGATLDVAGNVKIVDGTQGEGKALTSDASGAASWKTVGLSNLRVFNASGVYSVPAGVTKILVEVWGGGGGGGSSGPGWFPNPAGGTGGSSSPTAPAWSSGGGGGGGGYCRKFLDDVSAISSVSVTVGAGGGGATFQGQHGNPGGTSSFGPYCSATGGNSGEGNQGQMVSGGGAGGTGSGGDINSRGNGGGYVHYQAPRGGLGGSSAFGGGGGYVDAWGVGGMNGGSPGGGGAGAEAGSTTGGNGGPGLVVVWEFR